MTRKAKTVLFIDSSVFLGCALEELDGSTIQLLKDIRKHLEGNRAILIVPELVVVEVSTRLKARLEALRRSFEDSITKKKDEKDKQRSRLMTSALEKSKKDFFADISTREKELNKVLSAIFKHRNAIQPRVTSDVILKGLRRALLMQPPFSAKDGSFVMHQDCVNFELLLDALNGLDGARQKELVICSDDPDYFAGPEKSSLNEVVKKELSPKVKRLSSYSNPAKMLQEKFKEGYKKKDVDQYPGFLKVALSNIPTNVDYQSLNDLTNAQLVSIKPTPNRIMTGNEMIHPVSVSANALSSLMYMCPNCHLPFTDHPSFTAATGSPAQITTVSGAGFVHCPNCGYSFVP